MKKVFFLSGLAADERSFQFLDLSFCEAQFIEWKKPAPDETLASYAEKLFADINDEKAIIAGLSFGGMLAAEMAKNHPDTKVIIISSAKTYLEIPRYFRLWRHFPIYNLHFHQTKSLSEPFVSAILGPKGAEQKKVQKQIMKNADPAFTRWAINAIVNWRNTIVPKNVIHLHGTADKLLPYRYVKADYTIQKGEHVMLMDEAQEVSELLKRLIVDK